MFCTLGVGMREKKRCKWCIGDPIYKAYHDMEWGVPLKEDQSLFEFLTLETFQAGLSWITILRKRENFRLAFDGFDYRQIAKYSETKIQTLLDNTGIVRNSLKIRAAKNNAQCFQNIQEEFGSFSYYIWRFVAHQPIQNRYTHHSEIPSTTALANIVSLDLKKRGFRFVGPTVMYAHMQATGMVNDHVVDCFRYKEIQKMA